MCYLPGLMDHDKGEVASSLALATSGANHTRNLASVVRTIWSESCVTKFLLLILVVYQPRQRSQRIEETNLERMSVKLDHPVVVTLHTRESQPSCWGEDVTMDQI